MTAMTSTLGPLSFVLMGCWRYGTSLYGRSAAASNSLVPPQSDELSNAIAPKGQWILTGGKIPGVRDPSRFSLLHPGGVQAMPSLPVVTPPAISRTPLRGVALRQMLAMQSDDHAHAPPGRCSSLVFPRQSGHADLPLVCRTL